MINKKQLFSLKLMAYWLIFMGIAPLIYKPLGINYENGYVLISLHFIFFSSLSIFLFSREGMKEFLKKFNVSLLLLILIIVFLFCYLLSTYRPIDLDHILKIKKSGFIFPLFNYKVLLSKNFDILFQQILTNLLLAYYLKNGSKLQAIVSYTLFFLFIHLPLFAIFSPKLGLLFIIPSALGGASFATLICYLRRGREIAFALHWVFYLIVGCYFRYFE